VSLFKRLSASLVVSLIGVVGVSAQGTSDPLIGTWKLNLEKTKFSGTPPQAMTRTFDYTRDGQILVTSSTTNAQGNVSFLHWFISLDGKEQPEFVRGAEPKPQWWLATKVVDANSKQVHDRRAEGYPPQVIDYVFAVSPDGKTLTVTAKSMRNGQETTNITIFDKQ
jgi:hypothetical protein